MTDRYTPTPGDRVTITEAYDNGRDLTTTVVATSGEFIDVESPTGGPAWVYELAELGDSLRPATEADELRAILPPGTVVYCVLRHVSASGMSRWIDLYKMTEDGPLWLSYQAAKVLGAKINTGNHEGIKREGCGMDMGFDLVYSLSQALYPDGYPCPGMDLDHNRSSCNSNDHVNPGDRSYTAGRIHQAGGYALAHRWL